jgi:hypothetical protein
MLSKAKATRARELRLAACVRNSQKWSFECENCRTPCNNFYSAPNTSDNKVFGAAKISPAVVVMEICEVTSQIADGRDIL